MCLLLPSGLNAGAGPNNVKPPAEREPDEVGPNHRAWKISHSDDKPGQNQQQRANKPGGPAKDPKADTIRAVEIGTGMNYWDGKKYVPSDPRFDLKADSFVADRVQHAVKITANINEVGAVKLVTRDGKRLNSTPVAIGLYDAESGRSMIIATITNSAGVLVDENKVVFLNAFSGVCADIVYTLERESFEQDILFTGRVDPADYGFPAKTTRIQIYTEFYDAPRPDKERHPVYVEKDEAVRKRMASPDRIDEMIGFGEFVIGMGRAYTAATSNNPSGGAGMVCKEMQVLDNRTFLVESVEYVTISNSLSDLPPCNVDQAAVKQKNLKVVEIPRPGQGKEAVQITPRKAGKDLAYLGNRSRGVTVDYSATIGGTMNTATVFQGDTTYFVTGNVVCNGPVTIEGGTVIKYVAGKSILLQNTSLTQNTSDYRPAVFTALDDETVGESAYGVPGWTGGINGTYANPALSLVTSGLTLSNMRFRYATVAILGNFNADINGSGSLTVKHSQFTDCVRGISVSAYGGGSGTSLNLTLQNDLFANVQYPAVDNLPSYVYAFETVVMTECTFHNATALMKRDGAQAAYGTSMSVNGSLFSTIPLKESGATYNWNGSYNGFYNSFAGQPFGTSPVMINSYPFASAGAGNFYLSGISGCVNAGPASVTPAQLLTEIRKRTTSPPDTSYQNTDLWWSETWGIAVARDTDRLDIGYHYPALDYLVGGLFLHEGATLTWGSGVAVGINGGHIIGFDYLGFGIFSYGFFDSESPHLVSTGDAMTHNQVCAYMAVQEGAVNLNGWPPSVLELIAWTGGNTPATIDARFTDFNGISGVANVVMGWSGDQVNFRDCRFGPGNFYLESPSTFMTLKNNLFDRVNLVFDAIDWQSPIYFYNNLVRNSQINFDNTDGTSTVRDNLFEGSAFHAPWTIPVYDHNAYRLSTTDLTPAHTGDLTLSALTYASSTLGDFYVLSSTPTMVDVGSQSAPAAGLYHYTTKTTQVKEGGSQVDIGFHYVAIDPATGLPVDTDGDGNADYLEDVNGDGSSAGETTWAVAPSQVTVSPTVQSVNDGASAIITVSASGTTPFTYQWRFNGTPISDGNGRSGTQTATLTINPANASHIGNYSCTVGNSAGSTTSGNSFFCVRPATISGLPGTALSYQRGDPPVAIASGGTASFSGSVASGGILQVSFTDNYFVPGDQLTIQNQGNGTGQIGVSGSGPYTLSYGGSAIGTIYGGTGQTPLVVIFTVAPSSAAVNALLNALMYSFPASECMLPQKSRSLELTLRAQSAGCSSLPASRPLNLTCPDGLDVVLVLDRTGSMSANNDGVVNGQVVTRLQAATNAAKVFLTKLLFSPTPPTDKVGILTFYGDAASANNPNQVTTSPNMSSDLAYLNGRVNTINNGSTGNNTTYDHALDAVLGTSYLGTPVAGRKRLVIFLTDGQIDPGSGGRTVQQATDAAIASANAVKAAGIRLVTIGVGSTIVNLPANDPARTLLTSMATTASDCHFNAGDSLDQVFVDIANSICRGNQPPYALFHQSLTYTENAGAVVIDPTFELVDNDSDLNGGSMTVTFTTGGQASEDSLSVASGGNITVSGSAPTFTVSYLGNVIGTYTGGGGTTPLVVTFTTPSATVAAAQALMRAVTYQNSSENPSTGSSRVVRVAVVDGHNGCNNGAALTTSTIINVTSVNDAPTLTTMANLTGGLEDTSFTINYTMLANAGNEADVDSSPVNFKIAGITSGTLSIPINTVISSTSPSFTWKPDPDANGLLNAFTVKAYDGALASATAVQVKVNVAEVNDPPIAILDTTTTPEDTPLVFSASSLLINDVKGPANEAGQALTVTAVSTTQPGATVVLNAGTITYTPPLNFNGVANFSYTIQDNGTTSGAADPKTSVGTVAVTVTAVNDPPTLNPIADVTVAAGSPQQTVNLSGITAGGGENQLLTVSVSTDSATLIPSLSRTYTSPNTTGTVNFTPSSSQAGTAHITVTVTDNGGAPNNSIQRTFTVTVTGTLVVSAGPDQTIMLPNPAMVAGTVTGGTSPYSGYSWSEVGGSTQNLIPVNATYNGANNTYALAVNPGQLYVIVFGSHENFVLNGTDQILATTVQAAIVAKTGTLSFKGSQAPGATVTAQVYQRGVAFTPDPGAPSDNTRRRTAFAAAGFYQLQFSAQDSVGRTASDVMQVHVTVNRPPAVEAGPDRMIGRTAGSVAHLTGTVTDDGLPTPPSLTINWIKDPNNPSPNVVITHDTAYPVGDLAKCIATFSPPAGQTEVAAGVYKFTLQADDGTGIRSDDMTVTVVDLRGRTFTRNVDFEQGSLLNVNYDEIPDQLRLNKKTTPYPYVNVACSARGTVVRVDANTGQVIGEYRTAPNGKRTDPSRTTVDKYGNVWVGNRAETGEAGAPPFSDGTSLGSITRIGLVIGGTRGDKYLGGDGKYHVNPNPNGLYLEPPFVYNTCLDRDNDGLIKTSRGLGDIFAWNLAGGDNIGNVNTADDEAIINYVRVPGTQVRTVAIDRDNNVWVGGSLDGKFSKVDTAAGTAQFKFLTSTAYGGLIDRNGVLWSSTAGHGQVIRYDQVTQPNAPMLLPAPASIYGIGIDPQTGNIWYSTHSLFGGDGSTRVLSPQGTPLGKYTQGGSGGRGLAVDGNGHVWVALSGEGVGHLRTDGVLVGRLILPCAGDTTGIAVDANGNIWATDTGGKIFRINPTGGPIGGGGSKLGYIDMIVDLDKGMAQFPPPFNNMSAGPYNYSDMTGFVSLGSTAASGSWDVVHDSGQDSLPWKLSWHSIVNATKGATLKIEARAANTSAGLSEQDFHTIAMTSAGEPLTGGSPLTGQTGRFIETRVTFFRGQEQDGSLVSPVLEDLTVTPDSVVVTAENPHRMAVDDTFDVSEDDGENLQNPLTVLDNDKLVSGTLTISSVSSAHNGVVSTDGSVVHYTPKRGFYGIDRFTYAVTDGQGAYDHGLVIVKVLRNNPNVPPPHAANDSYTVFNVINGKGGDKIFDVMDNDDSYQPTDRDTDHDGVPDYMETLIGTDPFNGLDGIIDTDGDGMADDWERWIIAMSQHIGPPYYYTLAEILPGDDYDGDTESNLYEYTHGHLPFVEGDTDGDGVPDYVELMLGTNPNVASTADMAAWINARRKVDTGTMLITVSDPRHGSVEVVDSTGKFDCYKKIRYTPAPGYQGPDEFTYSVVNSKGMADTATVKVTVRLPDTIACGQTINAQLTAADGTAAVEDTFNGWSSFVHNYESIAAQEGQVFTLHAHSSVFPFVLVVRNPLGQPVTQWSSSGDADFSFTIGEPYPFWFVPPGVYTFEIAGQSATPPSTGAYQFTVNCTPPKGVLTVEYNGQPLSFSWPWGKVGAGSGDITRNLTLRNVGGQNIVITDEYTDFGDFTVGSPSSTTITPQGTPGDTVTLPVTLHTWPTPVNNLFDVVHLFYNDGLHTDVEKQLFPIVDIVDSGYAVMTKPMDGARYQPQNFPSPFELEAYVLPGTGQTITKVQFIDDNLGQQLGPDVTDQTPPGSGLYNTLYGPISFGPAGIHPIRAHVTFDDASTYDSSPVNLLVLPFSVMTVSLVSPAPYSVFPPPGSFVLKASAASVRPHVGGMDHNLLVDNVEFREVGGAVIDTVEQHTFNASWSGLTEGKYKMSVSGNVSSEPVTIFIGASVFMTAPLSHTQVPAGQPVNLTATFHLGTGQTFSSIEFYKVAGTPVLIGTGTDSGSGTYSYPWTGVAAGKYQVFARLHLVGGSQVDSEPLTVFVGNGVKLQMNAPDIVGQSFELFATANPDTAQGWTLDKMQLINGETGNPIVGYDNMTTTPYQIFWSDSPGRHTLKLRGIFNKAGNSPITIESDPLVLYIEGADIIRLTTPLEGTRFDIGSVVPLVATETPAPDNVGSAQVFFMNGTMAGPVGPIEDSGLFTVQVNAVPVGIHQYTATATFRLASDPSTPFPVESGPLPVIVARPVIENDPPIAVDDSYTIWGNTTFEQNQLVVTINDSDPNGDAFKIIGISSPPARGTAVISDDGKSIFYQPTARSFNDFLIDELGSEFSLFKEEADECTCVDNMDEEIAAMFGPDSFVYVIEDTKGGRDSAVVSLDIKFFAPPAVSITTVNGLTPSSQGEVTLNYDQLGLTTVISANVAQGSVHTIAKVELFLDGKKVGEVLDPAGDSTISWSPLISGKHYIVAKATDTGGSVGYSSPISVTKSKKPGNHIPVAAITAPVPTINSTAVDPAAQVRQPVVEGKVTPQGIANDEDVTDNITYQFVLRKIDGAFVADITAPINARIGTLPSTSAAFPTLDLTRFPDGAYQLELQVWDDWDMSVADLEIQLRNPFKIGRFAFSQEDLVVSGYGLSLTIARTYDSYNPNRGDFGFSWTYAISDLGIELDEYREQRDDLLEDEPFSMRVGGSRDVTLTLPDGRRTTFTYNVKQVSYISGDGALPAYEGYWEAEPGVTATLTTLNPGVPRKNGEDGSPGDNSLLVLPSYPTAFWAKADFNLGVENYDFPGYKLTLEDGTVYEITREDLDQRAVLEEGHPMYPHAYGQPRLSRIILPDGTVITINGDQIVKTSPTGQKMSAVVFKRDEVGRITAIYDPASVDANGTPNGWAAAQYFYDGKGNLKQVSKLIDRNSGAYETMTFTYSDNPMFPHYIVGITDPRGISPIINEYDSSGRITATTDIKGKRTEYLHESTAPPGGFKSPYAVGREIVRNEPILDRTKFTDTVSEYDTHGNVVASYSQTDPAASPVLIGAIAKRKYNTPEAYPDAASGWETYVNANGQTVVAYDNLAREETMVLDHTGSPQVQVATHEHVYYPDGKVQTETIRQYAIGAVGVLTDPITTIMDSDQFGQTLATTDAKGYTRASEYDPTTHMLLKTKHYSTRAAWLADTAHTGGTLLLQNHYDSNRRLDWSRDALNNLVVNTYYTSAGTDGHVGDLQKVEAYGYVNGTDVLLARTTFTYDALGNQKTETHYKDASINATPTPITTQFEYDAQNRSVRTIDALNGVQQTVYEGARLAYRLDKYGGKTTNVYNSIGEVVQTESPDHAIVRTVVTYDGQGQRQAITERSHFAGDPVYGTRITYDKLGRTLSTEQLENLVINLTPQGSGAWDTTFVSASTIPNSTTQTHYDDAGRIDYTIDAKTYQTSLEYDTHNRRKAVVSQVNGKTIRLISEFDANGGQTSLYTSVNGVAQPAAQRTDYQYDEYNRQTTVILPETPKQGGGTERLKRVIVYDLAGRKTEQIDQEGISTKYEYDGLSRLMSVTNAYKIYDTSGATPVVTVPDPPDRTTTHFKYDDLGNLIEQTDANQTFVTPVANQKHTILEYDLLSRRTKRTLPEGQFELYTYDPIPGGQTLPIRQTTRQDFNAAARKTIILDYDEMGRLKKKTPDASFGAPAIQVTYTATGQRASMIDAVGTTTYQYDNRDRLWKKLSPVGTLTYTYDGNNNLTTVASSNPNGVNLTYQYDVLNRLSTAHAGTDANNTVYNYDDFGNLDTYVCPNGVTTDYNYDNSHRLTDMNITVLSGGVTKTLATFNYSPSDRVLGKAGQRRAAVETITTVAGTTLVNRRTEYDYDPLYRLTKENITLSEFGSTHQGPVVYDGAPGYADTDGYDRVGNRLKRNVNSTLETGLGGKLPTRTYSYNANDWLASQSGGGPTTFDANGNTLRGELTPGITADDQTADDVYEFENRLARRTSSSGIFETVYDGDGNRVKKIIKTTGGTVIKVIFFVVSELNPSGYAQVVEEFESTTATIPAEGSRSLTRKYAYGNDLIFQERLDTGVWKRSYYGYDGHGNVRFLHDPNAVITDLYTYDAFGNLIENSSPGGTATPNNYLYCGEQFDGDAGMYFLRARCMNPNTGRFWTMDTYEGQSRDPASLHKYLYAQANPISLIDPSGNFSLVEELTTTFIQSALAALVSVAVVPYASQAAFLLVPKWVKQALDALRIPDAVTFGLSASVNFSTQYRFGFVGTGGFEYLWSPHTHEHAIYGFAGGGLTFGRTAFSITGQFTAGFVWGCPNSQEYTGPFFTLSVPYGVMPRFFKDRVNILVNVLYRWLTAPPPGFEVNTGQTVSPVVGAISTILEHSTFNLFWGPNGPAWGFSFGIGRELTGDKASSNVSLTLTGYWQIKPDDDKKAKFQYDSEP